MVENVRYRDQVTFANVFLDTRDQNAKPRPVAQTYAKMVGHVRYRDQVTFAIVVLDTRGHIAVPRPVAQIHVKTVEHVMLSIVTSLQNTSLLVSVNRGSMETNVNTHRAQIIHVLMAVIVDISGIQQAQAIGAIAQRDMAEIIAKIHHVLIFHVEMEDLAV